MGSLIMQLLEDREEDKKKLCKKLCRTRGSDTPRYQSRFSTLMDVGGESHRKGRYNDFRVKAMGFLGPQGQAAIVKYSRRTRGTESGLIEHGS